MTTVAILYASYYEFCTVSSNFVTGRCNYFMTRSVKLHHPVMKVKKKLKKIGADSLPRNVTHDAEK